MYIKAGLVRLLVGFMVSSLLSSCSKKDYLPIKRDNLGDDAIFNTQVFQPVLGRTTQYSGIFQPGTSTYPISFKIINVKSATTGMAVPELTNLYPVMAWTQPYTGKETSLAEIQAKQTQQYRPVLDIGQGSGDLTIWYIGNSSFIKAIPDSGYTFDIEASNSGGRRYFTNFKLQPYRERAFEPSNILPEVGQPITDGTNPSFISGIIGDSTNLGLTNTDVNVYIRKIDDGQNTKNKLTFRFYDKNYNIISPDKFATTNWATLVHGFNMQKTATGVTYDVFYPMPAVTMPTSYTNGTGDMASVVFSYQRLDAFGMLSYAGMGLNFAIYENGNWEIAFVFSKDNPRFRNE